MKIDDILHKAMQLQPISLDESLYIYRHCPTALLSYAADHVRKQFHNDGKVSWIIDRNVNITNACIAGCKFCNFHTKANANNVYITTLDEYTEKITRLFDLGGDQVLLQGGLHPKLGLAFYKNLFSSLKNRFPNLKLHALGPPEIAHIARIEKTDYRTVLVELIESGLDSLPGAGAEILSDRVRKQLSPGKCSSQAWLDVMREAHKLHMTTSATMMFGHIETDIERIEHLIKLREVQGQKPTDSTGFTAFIPWPYMDDGTELKNNLGVTNQVTAEDYIRLLATSRLTINNIANIQASWLTAGVKAGQLCLHGGANDFGSIMIEENVVSAAGSNHWLDAETMQRAIDEAGFIPQRRNQKYEYLAETN